MSNTNVRFEIIGDLYYDRYHRLRPGKSEAPETYRDSSDEENRTQFDQWFATKAFTDAVDKIEKLQRRIEQLEFDLEEANDHL